MLAKAHHGTDSQSCLLHFLARPILIYVLVVGWFRSFVVPLIIMAPIPLTLVGILPAHAMMGAFFTADLDDRIHCRAGIIVRNSIMVHSRTETGVTSPPKTYKGVAQ